MKEQQGQMKEDGLAHEAPATTGRLGTHTTRGDFLKWSTIAMGGLYVGPKITSFAVDSSMGQAGSSVPPTPNYPPTPGSSVLPPTGGAVQPTKTTKSRSSKSQASAWVPAAGAAAVALGVKANKSRNKAAAVIVENDADRSH